MDRFVDARADIRDDLGTILAQRNRDGEAAVAFKEALRLDPNLELAHFHLGVEQAQTPVPMRATRRRPDRLLARDPGGLGERSANGIERRGLRWNVLFDTFRCLEAH